MKIKILVGGFLSIILAYFARTILGSWLAANYAYSGSFIGFGREQNFDGFLSSYVFFSSFILPLVSRKIKYGFYFALPVLVLDIILGSFNPQLWLDLILLAAGLGLAHVILKIKAK